MDFSSARKLFERSVLPKALTQDVNLDLVNQARDIQKRFDIGDDDFNKIFMVAPQSQAKQKMGFKGDIRSAAVYGKGDYGSLPISEVPTPLRQRFAGYKVEDPGNRTRSRAQEEPTQLALTSYGKTLFERAGEIQKIRNETDQLRARNSNISRVRARRTGLPRR
jgi:hypothetical protein